MFDSASSEAMVVLFGRNMKHGDRCSMFFFRRAWSCKNLAEMNKCGEIFGPIVRA